MESLDYKESLLEEYTKRDADAIIRNISALIKDPKFSGLYRRLVKEGKITSATIKVEDVANALLEELKQEANSTQERIVEANFFDIAEQLKRKFGPDLAEIYTATKIPDEFMVEVRASQDRGDTSAVSEGLVTRYKNELVRIDKGKRAIITELQKYSNFPQKNAKGLSQLLEKLHEKLRSDYSYISYKPFFKTLYEICGAIPPTMDKGKEEEGELKNQPLFSNYLISGMEPPLTKQVQFRIAVNKLFQQLQKKQTLPLREHKQYWALVSKIFNYRSSEEISAKARHFLEELLEQVNQDEEAIMKRLAVTFIEEYREAEQQMLTRHNLITKELAYTREFLTQLAVQTDERTVEEEENIRIAQEKTVGLDGIFVIPGDLQDAAIKKTFADLENTALGMPTVITSTQLTAWIKIYSILFSNREFLTHTNAQVDFTIMRKYISDLTTYHLILNIAALKSTIDQSLTANEDAKVSHFQMFNDALKNKLQGLMGKKEQKEISSIKEMIEELSFLDNQATQFVIAETFKGFQAIVDAFNDTANEVFVRDREALLKESHELYSQICDQCMRNFSKRPIKRTVSKKNKGSGDEGEKKSWFSKIFS